MDSDSRAVLAIDAGSSHIKAGLFSCFGERLAFASSPALQMTGPGGMPRYDPQGVWETVARLVREVIRATPGYRVSTVGVTGMAETGLLVDRRSGQPRTPFLPWFDTSSSPQAQRITLAGDPVERYCRTGIHPTFKCALSKLLWLRDQSVGLDGVLWLGMPDWIAYRLTGQAITDPSLAGRTAAFRIDERRWDTPWIERWELDPGIFPAVISSGLPAGESLSEWQVWGLPAGTPVAVCGHDHVCGAYVAGVVDPGQVYDSMGTAEALIGTFEHRPLEEADVRLGLSYGCHTAPDRLYWMGGLSSSGGSIEWLRTILDVGALSYAGLEAWLTQRPLQPSEIIYFPYLLGSGSPHTLPQARGAFIGLRASHSREDLYQAVLEGTAYEMEYIRQVGETAARQPVRQVVAAGGGTRNQHWMQIKADVSGCIIQALPNPEMTLAGAALLAARGVGLDLGWMPAAAGEASSYHPDPDRHAAYKRVYEGAFLPLQEPLRRVSQALATA